ncbi:MAG: methionyl-tRNA formyltransferase [Bacteroidales bacterium]|nr:methionyl-tRNA formyltransferase [Bacteroidales bacterium]
MGTPEFAVASLKALVKSKHNVVGVVTVADKRAGRGKKMRASAVKEYALEQNIEVLQPDKLRDENFVNRLKELNADVFVVVAFRMLPKVVWTIPPKGTFNIHGSLLPQYRGAAPINYAIINGDTESGLTTFMIDEKIDTGKIIIQRKCSIENTDDAGELHDKLMLMSESIVVDTCDLIQEDKIDLIPQAEVNIGENPRPAPKIFKDDCKLSTSIIIDDAYNLIRGLSPYPASFISIISPEGEEFILKIFKSEIERLESIAGAIYTDEKKEFFIGLTGGRLRVLSVQLQSKKRMDIRSFLSGFSINNNWRWA